MGVGNGGFAGSIQGRTNEMPDALRRGYATAGTDTGHQEPGGDWAIGHPEKMIDFALPLDARDDAESQGDRQGLLRSAREVFLDFKG